MKITVVGDMNPTQQFVIDKMIADGHEIVYIGKDWMLASAPFDGVGMDFGIVDEYSDYTFPTKETLVKEVKKPYYRVKERY
jgi:hypothetical protein